MIMSERVPKMLFDYLDVMKKNVIVDCNIIYSVGM